MGSGDSLGAPSLSSELLNGLNPCTEFLALSFEKMRTNERVKLE